MSLMSEKRIEGRGATIECLGRERLEQRILEINEWARREGITVRYVSGMLTLRGNPEHGLPQVLLVKGNSADGTPKEFWQFPGGYEHPEDGGDHVRTLERELQEELDLQIPGTVEYLETYIPKPKPGVKMVLAIHCFATATADWNPQSVKVGSDVSEYEWTDDPLREKNGGPRILTEQVDYILRRRIGYQGPINKNTCPDAKYRGSPFADVEG